VTPKGAANEHIKAHHRKKRAGCPFGQPAFQGDVKKPFGLDDPSRAQIDAGGHQAQ
jgi:hypothetical protein